MYSKQMAVSGKKYSVGCHPIHRPFLHILFAYEVSVSLSVIPVSILKDSSSVFPILKFLFDDQLYHDIHGFPKHNGST